MRTVGLDTAHLIDLIEENRVDLPLMRRIFEAVDCGQFRLVTAALTLAEVIVHPLRKGDLRRAAQYRHQILVYARHLTTNPVSPEVAEFAARMRAEHPLRTPNAIQPATAAHAGAAAFITNSPGLPR